MTPISQRHTPIPLLTPDEQQGLLRGVVLERSRPWGTTLRFALFFMPAMWLLLTGLFVFLGHGIFALFDALAWSTLITTVATLLFHIFYPMLLDPPRLRLRNEILQLQINPRQSWSLPLDESFQVHLLYREHKEDALVIVQPAEDQQPLFLYGRYRNYRMMPPQAIPISALGFSLAEVALDQIGAWMMPDREQEYIAPLSYCLFDAIGYDAEQYTLPLLPSPHTLHITPHDIALYYHSERLSLLDNKDTYVEPYVFIEETVHKQSTQLLLSLEADHEKTVWVSIEWPLPLQLSHLPQAPAQAPREALPLTAIDAVIFLHHLDQTELLPNALMLLQATQPTAPKSTPPPAEEHEHEIDAAAWDSQDNPPSEEPEPDSGIAQSQHNNPPQKFA